MKFTNRLKAFIALIFCAQLHSPTLLEGFRISDFERNPRCEVRAIKIELINLIPSATCISNISTPSTCTPISRESSQASISSLDLEGHFDMARLKKDLIECTYCWKGYSYAHSSEVSTLTATDNWYITYTTATNDKIAIEMPLNKFLNPKNPIRDLQTVTLIDLKQDRTPLPLPLAKLNH